MADTTQAEETTVAAGGEPPAEATTAPPSTDDLVAAAGADGKEGEKSEEELAPSTANLRFSTRKHLLQAMLERVAPIVPSRDVLPVLKNFYVEVTSAGIKMVATDTELSVMAWSPLVMVRQEGIAVFPGKRFLELVKEAEEGDAVIDVTEGTAVIKIGRAEWTLKLQDDSDYPPLPEIDQIQFYPVSKDTLVSSLLAVRYAAATDTTRPTLMMIDISEKRMRAADGVRFQQIDMPDWPEDLDIDIPIRAVDDLLKLLKTSEAKEIEIGDEPNFIVFRIGGDVFIVQKIDAVFPEVDNLLLKPALTNDKDLHVDRQDLLSTIKRVRVVADEESHVIVLQLENPNKLTVLTRDKYGNMATESVDCHWQSEDKVVAFNHVHLTQMLEMADVKSCHFFLGEDASKTRPQPIRIEDQATGMIGVLNQIRHDLLK